MKKYFTRAANTAILALACTTSFAMQPTPQQTLKTQVNPGTLAGGIPQLVQLPDLVPEFPNMGGPPVFGIRNIGKAASASSVLFIHCEMWSPSGLQPCNMNDVKKNVPAIGPGDMKFFTMGEILGNITSSWAPGQYQFSVTVDVENQVKESDESNNSTKKPYYWNK